MNRYFVIVSGLVALSPLAAVGGGKSATGRAAAARYFEPGLQPLPTLQSSSKSIKAPRTLKIKFGRLLGAKGSDWLEGDVQGWSAEIAGWGRGRGQDWLARGFALGFQSYFTDYEKVSKVSLLRVYRFPFQPDFPVYLNLALGPGIFIEQEADESVLSLDGDASLGVQLQGARGQFFVEGSYKKHWLVLSRGQLSSWSVTTGVSYLF